MMTSAVPSHLLLMLVLLRPSLPFWTATVAAAPSPAEIAEGGGEEEQQPSPKPSHPPKDSPFGRQGRLPSELDIADIAAIFNKVAYGTTATPPTSQRQPESRPTSTTTTSLAPTTQSSTTTVPPLTSSPALVPPTPPTPLHLPPPPGPLAPGGSRRPHVQPPEYFPPKRPPPLPAEYNPFANKPILRGSQSDGGSGSTGVRRPPPPAILPPRPPPERELIPLRPVNTPSHSNGAKPGGSAPGTVYGFGSPTVVATHTAIDVSSDSIGESSGAAGEREGAEGGGDAAQDQAVVADSDDRQRSAKPTELVDLVDLDQVNKDSIIGPRSESRPSGKLPVDPTDSDVTHSPPRVVQQPAVAPEAPSQNPSQPPARSPRPGADWTSTSAAGDEGDVDLRLARVLHVYIGAALFASLAILAAAAGLRAGGCGGTWARRGLAPRKHLAALAFLLVAIGAANCAALICEVFADDDKSSSELVADVVLPCVPAAFALFLFVVMQRNQVWCGRAGPYGFGTPALSFAIFVGLGSCATLEAIAAAGAPTLFYLHLAARGLAITACSLLGLVALCLFRRLDRAAAKTQAEQLRAAFSTTTMTTFQRGSRPALRCAVRALLAAALLLLILAALLLYQLIYIYLLMTDRTVVSWLPWSIRCAIHASILSACFLLLWGATRGYGSGCSGSSNSSARGPGSTSGDCGLRGITGGPGGIGGGCGGGGPTLSLVSCGKRRFLFDCPSTGSDENRSSEDGAYPAVCSSNRAVLNYNQNTGRKGYDGTFPLSSLHSGAPSSSGDDFSNMPTMPKRRPAQYKSGTLLPPHYNKEKTNSVSGTNCGNSATVSSRRAGVHTLGPNNHIYADDNMPQYATLHHEVPQSQQGTGKRSSRARKNHRHSKHRGAEDLEHRLDGLADDFQVFKQYASSSEDSGDNYDELMFVNVPQASNTRRNRGSGEEVRSLRRRPHVDSLSPASPSDLSDCDRLSSSYDETAPMRPKAPHRGKALLKDRDASEDDVTPDSAVVADILSDKAQGPGMSPVDKRTHPRRLPRRPHHHLSHESPSSPEVQDRRPAVAADNPW